MSTRYILNTGSLILAAFLLVATQAFAPDTVGWLGFAVSAAVVLIALGGFAASDRVRQYGAYAVLGVVAAWTLIASLVFDGTVAQWLIFGGAGAIALIALGALAIHEVTTERVVHTLELRDETATDDFDAEVSVRTYAGV